MRRRRVIVIGIAILVAIPVACAVFVATYDWNHAKPWLEARAFDIIQPDVTKVGGLSEGRRIGWMADDHNVLLVPHGFNTAVGVAAARR